MVLIFLMLAFLHQAAAVADTVNTNEYFMNGYLKTTKNAARNFQEALYNCQEFYRSPMDGTINKKILEFMKKFHCGVSDDLCNFSLNGGYWIKRHRERFFLVQQWRNKI